MARVLGRLLLASLWSLGAAEDYEVFPLSGGVVDGVDVTIKVSGFDDLAKLQFLTAKRDLAFSWTVNLAHKRISRSSTDINDGSLHLSQSWGGWPFESEGSAPVTFTFTKRKFSWAVMIDGKRTPWLDYKHRSTDLITHVRVYDSFKDVEMTETRPTCTTECHPDECTASDGSTLCNDGPCYSTQPTESGPSSGCSNEPALPTNMHMHCCDGLPKEVPFESAMVKKWVEVMKDTSTLTHACQGYFPSKTQAAKCASTSGYMVQITSLNQWTHMFMCKAPTLYPQTTVTLPPSVLAERAPTGAVYKVLKEDLAGITVNKDSGFITAVTGNAANQVPQFWFVNMMTSDNPDIWHAYSDRRYTEAQADPVVGSAFVNLFLLNQELGATTACSDRFKDPEWVDNGSAKCAQYEENQWCTEHGASTKAWDDAHPGQTINEWKDDYHGKSAPQACCICGGGKHNAPPEAESKLLFSV